MNTQHISPEAEAARERARDHGKFGTQNLDKSGVNVPAAPPRSFDPDSREDCERLADDINEMTETMDVAFTISPDGSVQHCDDYIPEVWVEDGGKVVCDSDEWTVVDDYHPSENLSGGLARRLWEQNAEDGNVLSVVEIGADPDNYDENDPETMYPSDPIGWAIISKPGKAADDASSEA